VNTPRREKRCISTMPLHQLTGNTPDVEIFDHPLRGRGAWAAVQTTPALRC
jgi:hypothetical protein